MKSYWVREIKIKKGGLHKQLGISKDKHIPVSVLRKIMNASIGGKINYKGKTIIINSLIKKRANLALNLRKLHKK